jgi:hypothetical protein
MNDEIIDDAGLARLWNIEGTPEAIAKRFQRLRALPVLDVFKRLRDLAFQSAIGLDFNYFQYKRTIQPIARIFFAADGSHEVIADKIPTPQEAEFAVEFVINAVIQIENLVGDIDKPFEL